MPRWRPRHRRRLGSRLARLHSQSHVTADFDSTHTYGVIKGVIRRPPATTAPRRLLGGIVGSRPRPPATHRPQHHPHLELHYTSGPSFHPTDFIHDQYIEAAFILEKLRATSPLTQSMSYWTFTDIFEEGGPPRPSTAGFHFINLRTSTAAYFAYKFLAQLGPTDIATNLPSTLRPPPNPTTPSKSSSGITPHRAARYLRRPDLLQARTACPTRSRHPPHRRPPNQRRLPPQLIYRTGYQLERRLHGLPTHELPQSTSALRSVETLNQAASGTHRNPHPPHHQFCHFDLRPIPHAIQNDTVLVTLFPH